MKHILVVDDEPTIRRLIHDVLRDEGYAVSTAASCSEAIRALSGDAPRLVILDLLPEPERSAFRRSLEERHGDVPVLVVSGAVEIREAAEAIGAEFLRKPFDLAELVRIVRELTHDVRPPLGSGTS